MVKFMDPKSREVTMERKQTGWKGKIMRERVMCMHKERRKGEDTEKRKKGETNRETKTSGLYRKGPLGKGIPAPGLENSWLGTGYAM